MTDFTSLADEELVDFIDRNFHLFTTRERHADLLAQHLFELKRKMAWFIRQPKGFAMMHQGLDASGRSVDLLFLHVLPEFQGQGIAAKLIEQAKSVAASLWSPLKLTCETSQRCNFFKRNGFCVDNYDADHDLYAMSWLPLEMRASD